MGVRFIAILTLMWILPIGFMDLGFPIRPAIGSEALGLKGKGINQGQGDKKSISKLRYRFVKDLSFGLVVSGSLGGGKVVINPVTGAKEVYGTHDLGGRHSAAELMIKGEPGKRFMVTLPKELVLKSKTSQNTVLTNFTVHPSTMGTLDRQGKAHIYIGATLTLQPRQSAGKGSNSFNVYIDYLP